MRLIKMFGLAAIAAVAAMAFLGAGTASATQSTLLCKKAPVELKCPAGEQATEVHGIAVNALLDTTLVDVLCNESLAKATLLGLGEAPSPQVAHVTSLTWTNCHRHGGGACEVKTLLLGLLNILKLSPDDAHVKGVLGAGDDEAVTVLVRCGLFIHCTYDATAATTLLALPLKDGVVSTLHANTKVTESKDPQHEAFNCPDESTWTALYASLAATDVHIAS